MAYKFRLNLENGLDIGDLTLAWGIGDEFWNRDHHQFRVTDLVAGEDLDRDQYCGAGVVAPSRSRTLSLDPPHDHVGAEVVVLGLDKVHDFEPFAGSANDLAGSKGQPRRDQRPEVCAI